MDNAPRRSTPRPTTILDLPDDIWIYIFSLINQYTDTKESVKTRSGIRKKMIAARRILSIALTCKDLNRVTNNMIGRYLGQIERGVASMGGKDKLLYEDLMEPQYRHLGFQLVPVYLKLGANINTKEFANGDTPLTNAIKKNDLKMCKKLINLGADIMHPNFRYQVPIDLACESGKRHIAVDLKDRGGDPDNKYDYHGANSVLDYKGGYKNSRYTSRENVAQAERLGMGISEFLERRNNLRRQTTRRGSRRRYNTLRNVRNNSLTPENETEILQNKAGIDNHSDRNTPLNNANEREDSILSPVNASYQAIVTWQKPAVVCAIAFCAGIISHWLYAKSKKSNKKRKSRINN